VRGASQQTSWSSLAARSATNAAQSSSPIYRGDADGWIQYGNVAATRALGGHERPEAPRLTWPAKRNGAARISEQESKILITQWLESHGNSYSIETPTQQEYTQSGTTPMSGRIDVTVYGSCSSANRVLNLELKAGTASLEAFRKDFEKLLREEVPGLWFHTLTCATRATWRSIEASMLQAFDLVLEHAEVARHSVHFAFCVLDTPMLIEFDIDFSAEWRGALSEQFRAAQECPLRPTWEPKPATQRREQIKALVYVPTIEPRTFVHLSTRGDSYALRSFGGARPVSRWVEPDCKTTTDLLVFCVISALTVAPGYAMMGHGRDALCGTAPR
jgi:hypothetical protein